MSHWFSTFWRSPEDGSAVPTGGSPVGGESSSRWQKALLILAAALVSVYLVSVLVHSRKMTDIGLTCIFSTDVLRANPLYLYSTTGAQLDNDLTGHAVEQIGPYPIATWPDYLRSLRKLNTDPLSAEGGGSTFRLHKGEEQVLVRLRSDTGQPEAVWCRVDRSAAESTLPSVLWFGLKGSLFLVSFFVFWKRPHDRSAAQFFVLSIVTVGAFMGGYHWWRITSSPVLTLVFIVSSVLLPAVNLHFYLLFPQPKRFLKAHPFWSLLLIYGVPVGFLVALIFSYFHTRTVVDAAGDVEGALLSLLELILVYLGVAGTLYVASVICLVHSWWTATDTTTRNQVKCILAGSLLALMPIGWSLYLAIFERDRFGGGAATWPMFAASACFTVAYAISITRYRLLQLDQLLSSGVVYFLISFLAALVYYAVVFATMLIVGRGAAGPSLSNALIFSMAAVVLAVLLDLARSRLKKALDRRFHKEKKGLDRTLQQMGEALERLVDPPTLARRLLQASAELLGVARGSVYLREGQPPLYRLADSLGPPPALGELASGCPLIDSLQRSPVLSVRRDPWGVAEAGQGQLRFLGGEIAQALTHEGQLLALLVLGPKDSGPYTTEDQNLLAALAQITALALENAASHHTIETLNRDLHGKVEKISEQQRRILALQSQLRTAANGQPAANGEEKKKEDNTPVPGSAALEIAPLSATHVGSSAVVQKLLQLVKKVAQSQSAVLLRGESGTGKELLARALHEHSPRAGKAFVKVHCAALSAGLLESELFGHVKGAYTGAHRDKVGRFEMANGGTLFLDEIGDISLEVQTKLLRVLQEMTFERVGSSEPVQVDVRVVAATHQDLEELIRQGKFREDLYYRLNVISIQVPPLRERREDIPELAMHFLRLYAQRAGQAVNQIDDDALAALKGHAWPGNIRQLENVIERAVVVAEGPTITTQELSPEVIGGPDGNGKPAPRTRPTPLGSRSRREERDRREKEELVRALAQAAGNKAEAARALGVARSTLLSKLKKFGLS